MTKIDPDKEFTTLLRDVAKQQRAIHAQVVPKIKPSIQTIEATPQSEPVLQDTAVTSPAPRKQTKRKGILSGLFNPGELMNGGLVIIFFAVAMNLNDKPETPSPAPEVISEPSIQEDTSLMPSEPKTDLEKLFPSEFHDVATIENFDDPLNRRLSDCPLRWPSEHYNEPTFRIPYYIKTITGECAPTSVGEVESNSDNIPRTCIELSGNSSLKYCFANQYIPLESRECRTWYEKKEDGNCHFEGGGNISWRYNIQGVMSGDVRMQQGIWPTLEELSKGYEMHQKYGAGMK